MAVMSERVDGHSGRKGSHVADDGHEYHPHYRVTIEPALAISTFGVMMIYLIMQNMMLDKACQVNLNYPDDVCDAIATHTNVTGNETLEDAEVEVQKKVAEINQWKYFVDHAFPILFCLVMGAWSNKHGRKPLLISPNVGYLVGDLSLILNTWMWEWPVEVAVVMFGVLHGLGGASVLINLGTISYIGDVATPETKTQRLGLAIMCYLLPTPLASAAAGPIFESLGYYGVYGIASGCFVVSIAYYLLFVPEPVKDTKRHRRTIVRDMFDASQIYHSVRVMLKRRPGLKTLKIIILCNLGFFSTFYQGEMSILYYFTNYVFEWDITKYGYYNTYRFVINITGILFALFVLSRLLKFSDALIGILGSASQILASLCMILSYNVGEWLLYVGPAVDLVNGAVVICTKSLLSKTAPRKELGQLAAVTAVVEAIVPVVASPLYSYVYEITLDTEFPGAPFTITVACMLVCITAFLFLYVTHCMDVAKEKSAPPVILLSSFKITETKGVIEPA